MWTPALSGHEVNSVSEQKEMVSFRKRQKKNTEKYEFYKKMNGNDVNGIVNDSRLLFLSQDVIQSNLE